MEVRNRYDTLLNEQELQSDYGLLTESVTTTALNMLPKKKKKEKNNPYNDPKIEHQRNILKEASLAHRIAASTVSKENLEEAKKQLDDDYTTATK